MTPHDWIVVQRFRLYLYWVWWLRVWCSWFGHKSLQQTSSGKMCARCRALVDLEWVNDCERWRGRVLTGKYAHWCHDWDGLPVDETCPEWSCCLCWERT
jgi:hypothetical protein